MCTVHYEVETRMKTGTGTGTGTGTATPDCVGVRVQTRIKAHARRDVWATGSSNSNWHGGCGTAARHAPVRTQGWPRRSFPAPDHGAGEGIGVGRACACPMAVAVCAVVPVDSVIVGLRTGSESSAPTPHHSTSSACTRLGATLATTGSLACRNRCLQVLAHFTRHRPSHLKATLTAAATHTHTVTHTHTHTHTRARAHTHAHTRARKPIPRG